MKQSACLTACLGMVLCGFAWRHFYFQSSSDVPAESPETSFGQAPSQSALPAVPSAKPVEVDNRKDRGLDNDSYAEARVLSQHETQPDARGCFQRVRIVLIEGARYPKIRVEDKLTRGTAGDTEVMIKQVAMVADHMIVRIRPGLEEEALYAINVKYGAEIRKKMLAPDTYLIAFLGDDPDALPQIMAGYRQEVSAVAYAEPDYLFEMGGMPGDGMLKAITGETGVQTIPNDPKFPLLWNLHNTGQTGGKVDADLDMPEAWSLSTGRQAVVVGVLDGGVDTHPDLVANLWTNPGEIPDNGVDDDENGFIDDVRGWNFAHDNNIVSEVINYTVDGGYAVGHGTPTAGIIGAVGNNGIGLPGICPNVRIVAIKAGGFSPTIVTVSSCVEGIYYASKVGCDVLSSAAGETVFTQALYDAIEDADQHGVLVVWAAMNSCRNLDYDPTYPAAFDLPNIISVAAVDHKDNLKYYSNFGATNVDIAAPTEVWTCSGDGGYGTFGGTSAAQPHVAGVAALVKAFAPHLTHHEVKKCVLNGADPVPSLAGLCVTGGRLNAFNALQVAKGAFLAVKASRLDDDSLDGTSGNNNGIVGPGELIGLDITVRNLGMNAATGVTATLSLATANAKITLIQDSVSIGDLSPDGEADGSAQFRVQVGSTIQTPSVISFLLTIRDGSGKIWTSAFDYSVYASSSIGGKVTRATGGSAIAGARVDYVGPVSGSVFTGEDGCYFIPVLNGSYRVKAGAAGVADSPTVMVTTPPESTNLDFALGNPEIGVSPGFLSVTVVEEQTGQVTLAVSNSGDAPLEYAVGQLLGYQQTGLWHETTLRAHDGSTSYYYGIDSQKNYFTGVRAKGVLTSSPVLLPPNAQLSFWQFQDTLTHAEDKNYKRYVVEWTDRLYVQISDDHGSTWNNIYQGWQTAGLRKWVQQSVDLAAYSGKQVLLRFSFEAPRDRSAIANTGVLCEGWYIDGVAIDGQYENWLTTSPSSGIVAPGQSASITVSLNPQTRGVYSFPLRMASNDSDEGNLSVPVTLTVTGMDSDGDGIPDWWEDENSLNSSDDSDAGGDDDKDGMSSLEEYVAGTDPRNGDSCFKISAVSPCGPDGFELSFMTQEGRLYTVEYLDHLLSDVGWQVFTSDIPGTGGTVSVQDPVTSSKRYYRIKVRLE